MPRSKHHPRFSEDVTAPAVRPREQDRRLLVLAPNGAVTHAVDRPTLSVGRSVDADLQVEDAALSRVHVRISFVPTLSVTDLGSSNGTRLRGAPIEANVPEPFEIGDLIDCGHTTLVVQAGRGVEVAHRIWAHEHFLPRVDEHCADAETLAVVRVRVRGTSTKAVESAISALVGAGDLVARYAPGEYEIMLDDAGVEEAEDAIAALRFGMSRVEATVEAGIACAPRDGRDAVTLSQRAGEALHGGGAPAGDDGASYVVVSRAMVQLQELADRIAPSDLSVLLLGETGAGKEVLARRIHERSKRGLKPFLALNCGGFSEELLESELFGHERGAFTGAVAAKPGLLETAEGGTILLDELGEMPMSTQVKLLRVLEDGEMRRLGSVTPVHVDVRLIAATNRDLEEEIRLGSFREDLFYRLNGITLVVPPLRERRDEILPLAEHFAARAAKREGRSPPPFEEEARAALTGYAWPGNVRELRNVIERAVVLAGDGPIRRADLPADKLASSVVFTAAPSLGDEVERLERERILAALDECGGNQSRAAEKLQISRKTLLRRLDRYGVPRPRKGRTQN